MSLQEILEEIPNLTLIEKERLRQVLDSEGEHPDVLESIDKGRLSLREGVGYTAEEVRSALREWVSK
jgi:hypothetical protein